MISPKTFIKLLQCDDKELDKAVDAMDKQALKDLVKVIVKTTRDKNFNGV